MCRDCRQVGPSEILNVLRLLDESATNVLRHASATTITIAYGMSDGRFFASVADNGVGRREGVGDRQWHQEYAASSDTP